ncbi:MAG: protein kinase domain-containing protein [Myxococcota bacterium]
MKRRDSEELEQYWDTLVDMVEEPFDKRESVRRDIPETLPRVGISSMDTLPPLNPRIRGERSQTIDFLHVLKTGGMGEIHVARQKPLGRQVAVKRLREAKRTERHRIAMLEEGWITGRLQHPNIIPVYTLGRDDDDQPAIVMKLIEGVSLAEILDDFDKLPEAFAAESQLESHLEILIQVCNAISYTHDQGIIHRDIKPANIMVGQYGEVYLLDWGIATPVGPGLSRNKEDGSSTGAEGTPAYMAPEMASPSFANISRRTDIFLLGACLHEILTGDAINDGESYFDVLQSAFERKPPEYGWDVPEELAEIATRALSRDPADRYRTAVEFRSDLRDFLKFQTSWRLAEVAHSKLTRLEEKLDADGAAERNRLYPMFGACRFGFQHALEIRPDNERARAGLQRALEAMIDWELRLGEATAAEILLNSLPEPNPELAERVARAIEMREQRKRESLFTQMSPDAVVAVDASGTIIYANEHTSVLFGYEADELVGQKVEMLVPEAHHAAHIAHRESYSQNPTNRPMGSGLPLEGVHKDGSRVPVDISLAPVQANGNPVTIASIRKNRRATGERAADSRVLMPLEMLSLPICLVVSGRLAWCNTALADALDYDSKGALLDREFDAIFPDAELPEPTELERDTTRQLKAITARRQDGKNLLFDLQVAPTPAGLTTGGILVEAYRA